MNKLRGRPTSPGVYFYKGEVTDVSYMDDVLVFNGYSLNAVAITDDKDWKPFMADFSRHKNLEKNASLEGMLESLAGAPDYAVCVMAWPWPDGGSLHH